MVDQLHQPTPGHIQVERAIYELRAGRPVVVSDLQSRAAFCPVESLDGDIVRWMREISQGSTRLLLTAVRLARLGVTCDGPGFLALRDDDPDRARKLALDVETRVAGQTCVDAHVTPARPFYGIGLDLLSLANLLPAAVVAPLASTPASLLSVSVSDIMLYRSSRVSALRLVTRAPVPLEGAPQSEIVVFRGGEGLRDQAAIVVGQPDFNAPVSVRLHSACLTGDLLGSLKCDCGDQLRNAVRFFADNGGGVLLYLDQEGRGNGLSNKIRAYELQAQGYDTFDADESLGLELDQRRFDFAAEMLKQLGVRQVRVMTNNPGKIAALETAGLEVVSDHRILGRINDHNIRYLASKRDRAGHLLDQDAPA